ncbi:MAG: hypothetical protein CNA95_00150 [Pelagibacterales bacterium MED-G41]|nr:MAG: hypothetical protein CNA95_00150 [Pelagibacterales bacterium MED-G41]
MTNKFFIFFFLLKFILLEIKNQFYLLFNKFKFYKNHNLLNYFGHKFLHRKLLFKNKDIDKFLKKNIQITKQEKPKNFKKNKILVELLLPHHSEPMIMNCLIAKDLQKLCESQIVALINKDDLLTKKIAESFGIKNFIYLNKNNFLKNIYYFILALKLVDYNDIEKKIIKLKFSGYEVGKAALENYLRWHNNDLNMKDKFLLFLFLSRSILTVNDAKSIFKENYKFFVMGELQFIPNKLLFHCSLKSKTAVYCNFGTSIIDFIGRLYKNYKDRNSVQLKFSKKFSNLLIKIFKNKSLISIIKKKGGISNIGKEIVWSNTQNIKTIKFQSKNKFYKYFHFDKNKKTVLILPHAMSDNLFNNEWNVFDTAYDWYYQTIKKISQIDNVNWLIKPHPYEYKFPGVTARDIFEKIKKNKTNVEFIDEGLHVDKIYKFIDLVITGNGSAGYQYTALGIPTITTSDTKYSNFNFTLAPRNQNEYFSLLKKIDEIPKPSKAMIKKAQIYWLTNLNILYNSHNLLPKIKQHGFFKKELFFKKISQVKIVRYKKNSFSEDLLIQMKNKNRHSINSLFYKKNSKKYNFKLNDI